MSEPESACVPACPPSACLIDLSRCHCCCYLCCSPTQSLHSSLLIYHLLVNLSTRSRLQSPPLPVLPSCPVPLLVPPPAVLVESARVRATRGPPALARSRLGPIECVRASTHGSQKVDARIGGCERANTMVSARYTYSKHIPTVYPYTHIRVHRANISGMWRNPGIPGCICVPGSIPQVLY